ncbi:hypothetical protein CCR85_01655 [Rhodothalassium salexigens]|uniref:DUF2155 domain-containing protein n=1 Tax=Rhodothalassium salexigens TaxID=1086 RepID=UPI00191388A4|nr:DUF2155 domain-containing protein [Rhodothalassium salexigens]MBK5910198.1 hypothetical protein [Rhodothalassium salexigens]MBK5920840.1 hypothetical protein [Rhodothalassium salexigens]
MAAVPAIRRPQRIRHGLVALVGLGLAAGDLVAGGWAAGLCGAAVAQGVSVRVAPPEARTPDTVTIARALDKVTAEITELRLPEDRTVVFGSLAITARHCKRTPPTEAPETYAFLQIDEIAGDTVDRRADEPASQRLFSGWMMASSPALNALEHPVYDVWVLDCETTPQPDGGDGD